MRHRFTWMIALPCISIIWAGIGISLWQKHESALQAAVDKTRNLSWNFEENVTRITEAVDITIRSVRAARAQDPANFDLKRWLDATGTIRDLTLQIALADRTGAVSASNLGTVAQGSSIADRDHFRATRDRAGDILFISRPVLGRVSGRWSVQFVRKLLDSEAQFDGVVVGSLDPTLISKFYDSLVLDRGVALLLGTDGVVRSTASPHFAELNADLSSTPLMLNIEQQPIGTLRIRSVRDNVDRIYSWRTIERYGLVVLIGESAKDAFASYREDLRTYLIAGILITIAILVASRSISRHRSELLRSRAELQAAIDNISQGLMVVDPDRRVLLMNARAAELLELPPELTERNTPLETILKWQTSHGEFDGSDVGSQQVRTLVQAGGLSAGTTAYQRTRANGTVLEVRTKMLETGLAVRTITDMTEQHRTAQVLAEARDAAEAASKARSDFLAVMSHEIRTPLNGVLGIAALLDELELGEQQRDYVRLIRSSGDHLLQLLNDILDFSRLDASRLEIEAAPLNPRALLNGTADLFRRSADIKGLTLSVLFAGTIPSVVLGDAGRLRQILLNLVGNAIKFTSEGWVNLGLRAVASNPGQIRLWFSVADSGIGIPPDAVKRIFEEFTQVDSSISRQFGGSGLGLAICRRLVELMGGKLTVESIVGGGSTFSFELTLPVADVNAAVVSDPLPADGGVLSGIPSNGIMLPAITAPAPALALAAPSTPGKHGLSLLLVEDNPTNRIVACRMLERMGHTVAIAENGIQAIEAVAGTRFDAVLMDMMMPEMDGLTATRRIRAAEAQGRRLAIIGLTAGSRPEDLADCRAAGMDMVESKPVNPAQLSAALAAGIAAAKAACAAPRNWPTARLTDLAEALGDETVDEIVAAFVEDAQRLATTMQDAAGRGDSAALYRSAHSLAGMARNVGATALGTRAASLENSLSSLSAEQLEAELAELAAELSVVLLDLSPSPPLHTEAAAA